MNPELLGLAQPHLVQIGLILGMCKGGEKVFSPLKTQFNNWEGSAPPAMATRVFFFELHFEMLGAAARKSLENICTFFFFLTVVK